MPAHAVRALRVTYVGELGFELHMPIDDTGTVFDRLMAAGAALGIAPAGYRAIESLRLEKGYRAWGADITPNDNPFQAGLGWAVKLKSDQPFLGRGAIEKIANTPLPKRLMTFTVEDPAIVLAGRETILRNGAAVGYLSSAGWGYTVGRNIGLGYVRNADGVTRRLPQCRPIRARGGDGEGPGDASHGAALRSSQSAGQGLNRRVRVSRTRAAGRRSSPARDDREIDDREISTRSPPSDAQSPPAQ